MDSRRFMAKAYRVITALLFISCFAALPSFAASSGVPSNSLTSFSPFTVPLFSDFDGDHKVDHAELFSNGAQKDIHVTLGTFRSKSLSFDSGVQDHGQLLSDDIDSDGDADLVWVSQSQPRKFVMWLGDGHGNFSIVTAAERTHFQELLERAASPQLAGSDGDCESTAVLESTPVLDLYVVSSIAPIVRVRRSAILVPTGGSWTACLSVLRKRGPPSLVS